MGSKSNHRSGQAYSHVAIKVFTLLPMTVTPSPLPVRLLSPGQEAVAWTPRYFNELSCRKRLPTLPHPAPLPVLTVGIFSLFCSSPLLSPVTAPFVNLQVSRGRHHREEWLDRSRLVVPVS